MLGRDNGTELLPPKDYEYCQKFVEKHNEPILYAGWIKREKKPGDIDDRLLILTRFRLSISKSSFFGSLELQRDSFLFDLLSVDVNEGEFNIVFKAFPIVFKTDLISARSILQGLFVSYCHISRGCPLDQVCSFRGTFSNNLLNVHYLRLHFNVVDLPPDEQFLHYFQAYCSYYTTLPAVVLVQSLQMQLSKKLRQLSFSALEGELTPAITNALIKSLCYDTWFRELSIVDHLISDAGLVLLAETLAVNGALQRVQLNRVGATEDCSHALRRALLFNSTITSLDLGMNLIGGGMEDIVEGLRSCPAPLSELSMENWKASTNNMAMFYEFLTSTPVKSDQFRILNLSGNSCNAKVSKLCTQWLMSGHCRHLQVLQFNNSPDVDVSLICTALGQQEGNLPIRRLELAKMQFTDIVGLQMSKLVSYSSTLSELGLQGCVISIPVFLAIAAALFRSPGLRSTKLNASNIDMSADDGLGAVELASILTGSTSVASLILDDCRLGREGLMWIAQALAGHSTLEELSLNRNVPFSNILDLTLDAALSNLIQRTPSLRSLSIAGTYPNLRLNVIPIVTALSSPECGLTSLNISDNVTIDDLSAHISNLLVVTANLRELNIAGPLQSTASIAQILLGLRSNRTLLKLTMGDAKNAKGAADQGSAWIAEIKAILINNAKLLE